VALELSMMAAAITTHSRDGIVLGSASRSCSQPNHFSHMKIVNDKEGWGLTVRRLSGGVDVKRI